MWAPLVSFLSLFAFLTGIVLIVAVIMQRKEATSTLAWIILITFVPLIGAILYLWFGVARLEHRVELRKRKSNVLSPEFRKIEEVLRAFKINPPDTLDAPVQSQLLSLSQNLPVANATIGNAFTFYTDESSYLPAIFDAIRSAQDSVHCEFFIVQNDAVGREFCEALMHTAERGVTVRLLMDGVGSWRFPSGLRRKLLRSGVETVYYMPVSPIGRPWHWNFRNHRKMIIVDGTVSFLCSGNMRDTYVKKRGQELKSCEYTITCTGPVTRELQEVFAQDWFVATRRKLFEERYFPLPVRNGHGTGQVIASGPDEPDAALYQMICHAIHAAEKIILLQTPYLVPEQALMLALCVAARRGVHVRLLVGRHSPGWTEVPARIAGQSYYAELLKAGVEIWEYLPGFMHAKSIAIDGCFASVGTANMDVRSFRLNFELNINLYSKEAVMQIEEAFERYRQSAERITLQTLEQQSFSRRFLQNALRALSPVL